MIINTIIALGFVLYIVFVPGVCMSLVFVCSHYYTRVTVLGVIPSVYWEWFLSDKLKLIGNCNNTESDVAILCTVRVLEHLPVIYVLT